MTERIGTAVDRITRQTAYEDIGPTLPLTCSDRPMPLSPRKPPAAILRLIGELGLRYRPSAAADLEAHAASIALLARDVADIPANYLSMAVEMWVKSSRFMPKASELADMAQRAAAGGSVAGKVSATQIEDMAASLNAKRFTQEMGWNYFVARGEDGKARLDRTEAAR